jgi:hypothetical protein
LIIFLKPFYSIAGPVPLLGTVPDALIICDYRTSKESEWSTAFILEGPQEYAVFCSTSGIGIRFN